MWEITVASMANKNVFSRHTIDVVLELICAHYIIKHFFFHFHFCFMTSAIFHCFVKRGKKKIGDWYQLNDQIVQKVFPKCHVSFHSIFFVSLPFLLLCHRVSTKNSTQAHLEGESESESERETISEPFNRKLTIQWDSMAYGIFIFMFNSLTSLRDQHLLTRSRSFSWTWKIMHSI